MTTDCMRALLIENSREDAEQIISLIRALPDTNWQVEWQRAADAGIRQMKFASFDICLLSCATGQNASCCPVKQIRHEVGNIPILVLLENDDASTAAGARRAGATDCLVKDQLSPPLLRLALQYAVEHGRDREALLHADRMAVVGAMTGGVVHEFNNLNAGMLGMLEMALSDQTLAPRVREWLSLAHNAAERSTSVVRNLLAFSRKTKSRRQPTKLDTIADQTIHLMRKQLELANVDIDKQYDDTPPLLLDPAQIGQILMNLFINACHAMHERLIRTLTIKIGIEHERAFIRVEDTGCGIPPEHIKKLFQPFFTTKTPQADPDSVVGNGLGLSLSLGIAHEHNGDIQVCSEPGIGSTFTVWLPSEQPDAGTQDEQNENSPLPLRKEKRNRVLFVDDEEMVRKVVAETLRERGFAVTTCRDGWEAFMKAQQQTYDLLLLDLQMPRMGGAELLERIRKLPARHQPPCVVITGLPLSDEEKHAEKLGVGAVVPKPFEIGELMQVLHRVLAQTPTLSAVSG